MKNVKRKFKILGFLFVFIFIFLAQTKRLIHDDNASYNDIEEEKLSEDQVNDDNFVIDSLDDYIEKNDSILLATTSTYSVYNYNGVLLSNTNSLDTALKTNNMYKIKLNKSVKISYRVTIPRNMILDLNGYTITFADREGEYFITVGKGIDMKIDSSRPNGKIYTGFNKNGIVHLAGHKDYTSAQQPVVRIGTNVTLENQNADTIKNHSGKLYVYGGTIKPNNNAYNAILTRWEAGATNGQPIVEITGADARIYGIYMGQNVSGNKLYGGTVKITNGNFYPSRTGNIFGQTSGMNSLYITGGKFSTDKLGATNKSASSHRLVKEGNVYVTKRYSLPTFDRKGGVYLNGFTPNKYHYYGSNYNFPTSSQIRYGTAEQGFRFDGWYSNYNASTYTYSNGPYGYRTATNMDNKTYYARYTYEVTFDANNIDNKGKTINTPVSGSQPKMTFNAGSSVYNKMPTARYSRAGYKLLGWSTNKNSTSTNITVDTKQYWNFDTSVKGGKVTLYAIWEPINLGSSYRVEYYLQNITGTGYTLDSTRTTRFYSTAGNTSSPSIANINGFQISELTEHKNQRQVYVRGDGTSVVKLYYNRKQYTATFDIGFNPDITNLEAIKTKYGEDNVVLTTNNNGTKLAITFRHGDSVLEPLFNKDSRYGYQFQRWDRTFSNLTSNTTIKAIYEAKKISYVLGKNNGDSKNEETIVQTFDQKIRLLGEINNPGYVFVGWYDESGKLYDANTIIEEEETKRLDAYWKSTIPTGNIELLFKSSTSFTFTYSDKYEYLLTKVGDTEGTWVATSINMDELDPETEYTLKVRTKKALDSKFYEASDAKLVGNFTTLSATENSVKTHVEGGNILLTPLADNNKVDYKLVMSNDSEELIGKKEADGIRFTTAAVDVSYNIVYIYNGVEISYGQTVKTGKNFTGDTEIDGNLITVTDRVVSFESDASYEYSIDGGQIWEEANAEGIFTFNRLSPDTSYLLHVRHKAQGTEPASYSATVTTLAATKKAGIAPTKEEATHVSEERDGDDNPIFDIKTGFVYYRLENGVKEKIEPQNGKISYIENITFIEREANDVFAESISETHLIMIEKPRIEDIDKSQISITVNDVEGKEDDGSLTSENKAIVTPYTHAEYKYEYVLVKAGENLDSMIEGYLISSGEYIFENLSYATNYHVYIKKYLVGTPYFTEFEDSGRIVEIKKEHIHDDFDRITNMPKLEVEPNYNENEKYHIVTINNKELGFDYQYKNDEGEWINISGNQMVELKPNKVYEIRIRLNNALMLSNYIDGFTVRTMKTPKEHINHDPIVAIVNENVIRITNTLPNHEYAIAKVGYDSTKFDDLVYMQHNENGITFFEIIYSNPFSRENLEYNEEYIIVVRRIETEDYEQSFPLQLMIKKQVGDNEEEAKATVFTNKRATINVPVPEITEELKEKIKVVYTETEQTLTVESAAGFEYVVINRNDYSEEEIDFEKILKDIVSQDDYKIEGIKLSDEYLVFIRKKETDKDEVSNYVLLNNVEITKQERSKEGHNPVLNVILTKDDSIIIRMQSGTLNNGYQLNYEYSINGSNEWVNGFDGNYSFVRLSPNTEYEIVVRIQETEYYQASEIIKTEKATTLIKPTEKVEAPFGYEFGENEVNVIETDIKITTREGYEYSIDNETWLSHDENGISFDGLLRNTEYPIYVRTQENLNQEHSHEALIKRVVTWISKPTLENAFNDLTITDNSIRFVPVLGYEYKYNDEVLVATEGYISINDLNENQNVVFNVKRSEHDSEFEELVLTTKTKGQLTEEDKLLDLISTENKITVLNGSNEFSYAILLHDGDSTKLDFIDANEDGLVVFGSLEANTLYKIFLKKKATENQTESDLYNQEIRTFKLKGKELNSEERNIDEYEINEDSFVFTPKEKMEYSIDGGNTWLVPEDGKITVSPTDEIVVRRKETDTNLSSDFVVATKKTPVKDIEEPALDLIFDLVSITNNKIVISNETSGLNVEELEFSLDQINWFVFEMNTIEFENLKNNTVYQLFARRSETDNDLYSKTVNAKFKNNEDVVETVKTSKEKIDLSNKNIIITFADDEKVVIDAEALYKYSIDGGKNWQVAEENKVEFLMSSFNMNDYKFMMMINENNEEFYSDITEITNIVKYQNDELRIIVNEVKSNAIIFNELSSNKYTNIIIRHGISNTIVENNQLTPVTPYFVYGTLEGNNFIETSTDVLLKLVINDEDFDSFITKKEDVVLKDNEEYAYVEGTSVTARDGFVYSFEKDGEYSESLTYPENATDLYIKKLETVTTNESNAALAKIFKKKHEVPFNAEIKVVDITYHSITVETEYQYEYSINGATWQTKQDGERLEFDGLNPTTAYDILIRQKRTDSTNIDDRYLESDEYVIHTVTTDSYDSTAKIAELDEYAEKLGVKDHDDYEAIRNEMIKNYDKMTNTSDINSIYEAAKSAVDELLEKVKLDFIDKLLEIKQVETDEDVLRLIDEQIEKIQNSESKKDFENIVEIVNANIELTKLIKEDADSDAEKAIYEKGISDINDAKTKEEIEELFNKVKEDIHNHRIDEAKKEISDYRDANVENHNLDDVNEKISNAKTKEEIKEILDQEKALIDKKAESIKELSEILEKDPDNELKKDVFNDAKTKIEQEKDSEEINKILEDAKNKIDIIDAKKEISDFVNENYSEYDLSDVNEKLDNAKTKEEIKDILDQEKAKVIKKVVEDELKKHFENLEGINEGDIPSEKVQETIDNAIDKVTRDNYSDEQAIKDIVNDAKQIIDEQVLAEQKAAAIDKIVNDNPNPNEKAQQEIDNAIEKINEAKTKEEIDKIVNESQEEINLINKKQETKDELDKFFEDLDKNLVTEQSDEVKKIIEDTIESINLDNYDKDLNELIEDAKNKIKEQHLDEEKSKLIEEINKEFDEVLDGDVPSSELEDKKQAVIDQINDSKSVEEVKEVDKLPLIKDANKEKVNNEIDSKVDELVNGDDYSDENKAELEKIKEDTKKKLEENDLTPEEIRNELKDTLEKIKEVNVRRISNNDLKKNEDKDAKYPSPVNNLYAEIANENGMKSTTRVVVGKVDVQPTDIDKITEMLKKNQMNNSEVRSTLRSQSVFGQLEITLVDENDNKVTEFDGVYKVSVLLPEEFLNVENITVVYMGEELEVFTTVKEGNWVTFETTHFSDFYLIGDVPGNDNVNIWWLIILLAIVIGGEVIVILWKLSRNSKRLNAFTLPILATLIPSAGRIIVIVEIIIIIILAFVIIYLFMEKSKEYDLIEEEDKEEIVETTNTNVNVGFNRPATLYSYSFQSRLHLAPGETLNRYNKFKNHILRYEDVRVIKTWKHERFMFKGKTIAKIRLNGKTIRIYYNLDLERFIDTKYLFEDVSNTKENESTPAMFVVRGNRKLNYAMELVDIYMEENDGRINPEYIEEDYFVPSFTKEQLISKDLIKVNNISDEYKEIIFAEED